MISSFIYPQVIIKIKVAMYNLWYLSTGRRNSMICIKYSKRVTSLSVVTKKELLTGDHNGTVLLGKILYSFNWFNGYSYYAVNINTGNRVEETTICGLKKLVYKIK